MDILFRQTGKIDPGVQGHHPAGGVVVRVLPGAASRAPETEGGTLVALVWDEWWPEAA